MKKKSDKVPALPVAVPSVAAGLSLQDKTTMTTTLLLAALLGALLHPAPGFDAGQDRHWLRYADDFNICLARGGDETAGPAEDLGQLALALFSERLNQLDQLANLDARLARIEALLQPLVEAQTRPSRPAQEWFSIGEVATLTGLSADHVRRHVVSGQLPVSNQGTYDKPYYRIHRHDVDEWMAKRRESPSPAPRKKAPQKYVSRHHKNADG